MVGIDRTESRKIQLEDGREATLRPLNPDDAERLYWFYGGISEEDRRYLQVDVRERNLVIEKAQRQDPHLHRIIVEDDREIIAEAALRTNEPGWKAEIGEIRLLVAPHYRGHGLGRILARELYLLAIEKRLRKVEAHMMRPQKSARQIFKRLGFGEEALLPDRVTDLEGQTQDLVVMSLDVEDLRRDLRQVYSQDDWRRHR